MRLAIIVTEFPKFTETFILRDLVEFHRHGHQVRVFHLRPFNRGEVVHDFARPVLQWATDVPFLLDRRVLGALARTLLRDPGMALGTLARIFWELRRHPLLIAKALSYFPKSLAIAEELAEWRPHQIHAEFAGHPATAAWIIARRTGLPFSVSCRAHDIFVTRALLDTKLREASYVRTISDFNRRYLRREVPSLADREIFVIPSSVDVEAIPALDAPEPEPFRVLFVGSHEERKGIDVLLRALADRSADLGGWRGRIVGDGAWHGRLQRLAAELGLADRLDFPGKLPFEEIQRAYAWASVVVVPSVVGPDGSTEGIPNVSIEALAHQRPVIATRISGIPELVIDGETGFLVEPGDAEGLGEALVAVRRDPPAAYRLACDGRRRVAERFDLKVNAQRQLELLHRFSRTDDR